VLCFLIALAVPVALVTIRNHRVGHDTVLVSANGGLNFYLGNNPRADATIALRPGREWRHLVESPHRQAGLTRPSERSRWFYARALAWMRDEPLAAAANLGRKVLRYAGAVEIRRNEDLYTAREESTVLSLLLWRVGSFAVPFGIVLPLAVVGGLLGWPERRRLWPLYVYLAAYVLVVVLFFVTARYRLPAVPVLLGFAALTVDRLPRLRAAAPRRLLRLALLALAVGVIANLGLAAPRIDTAGEAWRLRAIADYERGDLAAAIEAQTRAVERRPQLAELHYDLGVYRAAAGDPTGAIDAYRRALELDPDYAEAMVNLGRLLARQDSVATAVRLLVTAAAIAPGLPAAQIAIAGAFLHNGRVDSALAHYDRAIQLDPALPESWQGRGAALIEGGRPAEAIEALRHALDLGGEDAATLATLGRALKNTDRLPEALVTLRRALELERNPRTLVTLGQVYRDLDRLAEARDAYREALRLDPNLVQAHINIADVYVRQGLYDMARAALEVALRLEPRNTTALFNQAIVESRLGDTERARWFLRRVLELDPDHAPAKHALEVIDGDAAH
jgi:tetratricopeptide (TPR) repeat protein